MPSGYRFNRRTGSPTWRALAIAFVVIAMSSSLLSFTFTTIDFPGAPTTRALGINVLGEIVGVYGADLLIDRGFLGQP